MNVKTKTCAPYLRLSNRMYFSFLVNCKIKCKCQDMADILITVVGRHSFSRSLQSCLKSKNNN